MIAMASDKIKRALISTLAISLTVIIILFLIRSIDLSVLLNVLRSIDLTYLALIFLTTLTTIPVIAKRYQSIMAHMGCNISFSRILSVNLAAYPLVALTPSMSGSVIKGYYLKNEAPPSKTIVGIVAERTFDMTLLAILLLAGILISFNMERAIIGVSILIAIITGIALMGRVSEKLQKGVLNKVSSALEASFNILRNLNSLLEVAFYTLIYWCLSLFQTYLAFHAVGGNITAREVIVDIPLGILAGQLPITVSGVGTRDAVFVVLFSDLIQYEVILAAGLVYTTFKYWVPSLLGIPFMIIENHKSTRAIVKKDGEASVEKA